MASRTETIVRNRNDRLITSHFALLSIYIAALLAGAVAVYFTKQQLDNANFQDAIQLIRNDTRAFWCERAQASIVQDAGGNPFCAVSMPKYLMTEENRRED